MWWSIVAITTVGYGDIYPITGGGKLIAIIIMVIGIGVCSSFTAGIASVLISSKKNDEEKKIDQGLHEIHKRLDDIEEILSNRQAGLSKSSE